MRLCPQLQLQVLAEGEDESGARSLPGCGGLRCLRSAGLNSKFKEHQTGSIASIKSFEGCSLCENVPEKSFWYSAWFGCEFSSVVGGFDGLLSIVSEA